MQKIRILGIQFRSNQESISQERASLIREIGVHAELGFISALDESLDWSSPEILLSGYQGVILGGSAEFYFDGSKSIADPNRRISYVLLERLKPLFSFIFDHDTPTLGICYGHQILGAFAGSQVSCDKSQGKVGSHEVRLMIDAGDYFLFSDLPESFHAHYGHKDSLNQVPDGAILLMSGGDRCRVSALQYKNNIYTTQFHPELTSSDMIKKMKSSPEYLPEGVMVEELFKDDPHSNTILQNFGKFVAMQWSLPCGLPKVP